MFRNSVMSLKMVSHEEVRDVYKYDGNKRIEDSKVQKVRCLFIRTVDRGWGILNDDGTFLYCHATVVDLPFGLFSQIDPKQEYECACDISEDNFHRSSISLIKIKIKGGIYDIKAEDAASVVETSNSIDA